jgi:hypothetical protein
MSRAGFDAPDGVDRRHGEPGASGISVFAALAASSREVPMATRASALHAYCAEHIACPLGAE